MNKEQLKSWLWVKEFKWEKTMWGSIELDWTKYWINIYKNKNKTEDRHPDYNLVFKKAEEKSKIEEIETPF